MTRKSAALACLILSFALHVHLAMQGHTSPSWLLFPVVVCCGAFLLPVVLPVVLIERACGFRALRGRAPVADLVSHGAGRCCLLVCRFLSVCSDGSASSTPSRKACGSACIHGSACRSGCGIRRFYAA